MTQGDGVINNQNTIFGGSQAQHAPHPLQEERDRLAADCRELSQILLARSALVQEVTRLNETRARCEELLALQQALKVHISELERQVGANRFSEASARRRRELSQMRVRLRNCCAEGDQLALELVGRQAFITDTTKQLIRKLRKHCGSFGDAVTTLRAYKQQLLQLESALAATGATVRVSMTPGNIPG